LLFNLQFYHVCSGITSWQQQQMSRRRKRLRISNQEEGLQ